MVIERFNAGNPLDINNLNNLVAAVTDAQSTAKNITDTTVNLGKTVTAVPKIAFGQAKITTEKGMKIAKSSKISFPTDIFTGDFTPVVTLSIVSSSLTSGASADQIFLAVDSVFSDGFIFSAMSNNAKTNLTVNWIAVTRKIV